MRFNSMKKLKQLNAFIDGRITAKCSIWNVGLLFIIVIPTILALLGVLPLDAARASSAEGRLEAEVNVLLRVQADDERGNVHNLLPDPDVPLFDEHSGVMDGLGESELEHLGLKPSLQEVLNLETEHEIELHASFIEDPDTDETPEQSVSLEQAAGILLFKRQQLSGSGANLGQAVLDPPDLTLVPDPC